MDVLAIISFDFAPNPGGETSAFTYIFLGLFGPTLFDPKLGVS
jgi:hypothetical protein